MTAVERSVEFDLVIEEGPDSVSDQTVNDIQEEGRTIMEEGARDMEEEARSLVPIKTGELAMSIYSEVQDVTGIILGASAPYASFIEFGTDKTPPHPFIEPAIDSNQPMIQESLDQMIADKLAQDSSEDDPEYEFNTQMEYEEGA